MKRILLIFLVTLLVQSVQAQGGFTFSCARDTTIDCSQNCISLKAFIPDVHAYADDYTVNPIVSASGVCFNPPVRPDIPGTSANLNRDDVYTPIIQLPNDPDSLFDFPFYGYIFNQLVVNTNGIISFDLANASQGAQWTITAPTLPSTTYDRAIIMGPYHDIDIENPTTSPNKQIKYDIMGYYPYRKWVLSFYKVPCYSNTCWNKINNTYQISLYESLGIIDVHLWGREICPTWNNGNAMVGIQNYDRDKGLMAPGREANTTPRWGSPNMSEAWRFVPKEGPTLFKRVELLDLNGNIVATGDTTSIGNSTLQVIFDNICPTTTTTYVIRSVYNHWAYPFVGDDVYGYDTLTVYKNGSIPAVTLAVTDAQCGANPNGSITVTAPVGANYEYSVDGGAHYQDQPVFSLPPGPWTVTVHDKTGTCVASKDTVINSPTTLDGTAVSTNTSCPTATNGTITVTGSLGTPFAGGVYEYALDGGTTPVFVSNNVFSGVGSGDHLVYVRDAAGCIFSFSYNLASDPGFTTTAVSVNATCRGVRNGSITVTQPSTGVTPFNYAIVGYSAAPQSSNIFTGLIDSTYSIAVTDNIGCADTISQTVSSDPGVTAVFTPRNTSCTGINNGYIAMAASNGTAPYFYSADTGRTFIPLDTMRNLGSGDYSVIIRDNVGCLYNSSTISIINGAGVRGTYDVGNASCNGVNNGYIVVHPTFGTGFAPYFLSVDGGTTFTPIDTIRNLAPGNHGVILRDDLGCLFPFPPINVAAGPGVRATFPVGNSACSAASTGYIAILPTAGFGTAPFEFSNDGGTTYQPIDTMRNLAPGNYFIRVRDYNGCIYDSPPVVVGANNPGVSATVTALVTECAAASTGQIIIQPTSGVSPFTYDLDNAGFLQLTDTLRNLDSGTHTIILKDALGCNITVTPSVGIGAGISATAATVATACDLASTGQIFVQPSTGISPYTYSLDNGGFNPLVDTLRNLDSGTHNIVLKDAAGCTFNLSPVVGIGVGVTARDSVVLTECTAASTGKIFIKVLTGIAPFEYSNDSGATWQLNVDSFTNLGARNYNIAVRDAVGCIYRFTSSVGAGPGINASVTTQNSACQGVSTGRIIIVPANGIAPYQYAITSTPPTPQSILPDTLRNMAAGTYSITISDDVGCEYVLPAVTVNNNTGVTASFTSVNAACAGSATGAIIVKPLTGERPFHYSLDAGSHFQYDSVFRKLTSGNSYSVWIRDTVGCVFNSVPQSVADNPGVQASPSTIKNASCAEIPNGSITVNVNSGIAPFTFAINPVAGTQAANVFTGLAARNYDITITDSAGCTKTIPNLVGNNPKVKIDSFSVVRPTCNGLQNGTVAVNVSLGTGPYEFAMDNPSAFSASKTFANVGAGAHHFYIRDANLCLIDSVITVTEPSVLTLALAAPTTPATCSGNPDGRIDVLAQGGTPKYEYTIDNAGLVAYQDAQTFDVLKGSYRLKVKDAMGCTAFTNAVVDSVFTMFLELGSDTTICAGKGITLSPVTNAETSVFNYTPNQSLTSSNIKNPVATPADTITYTLEATWGICKLVDVIKVNVLHKPVPYAGKDTFICYQTQAFLHGSASDTSGTVNYSWGPANWVDNTVAANAVATPPAPGNHNFILTVTDNYGCGFSESARVTVTMLPNPAPFAGNDTNAVYGIPHQLFGIGAGPGGAYNWSLVTTPQPNGTAVFTNANSASASVIFQPLGNPQGITYDSNYYHVALRTYDAGGCAGYDTVKIHVYRGPTYYVPNAFSPNGDGLNDVFRPIPVGIVSTEFFRIYNRFGQVVFETTRFMDGWDGRFKGDLQPVGAYVWILKGKDRNGKIVESKGTVTLVH